jgi:hypothetical protein
VESCGLPADAGDAAAGYLLQRSSAPIHNHLFVNMAGASPGLRYPRVARGSATRRCAAEAENAAGES